MTRAQFKATVQELLETSYADMTARVDKAIRRDYSKEPEGEYGAAKAIATALLRDAADNWRPWFDDADTRKFNREVNNIRICTPS